MKQVAGDSEDGDNHAMVPASLSGKRVNALPYYLNLPDGSQHAVRSATEPRKFTFAIL